MSAHAAVDPGVGTWVGARRAGRQPAEVVIPAVAVRGGRLVGRKPAVHEVQARSVALGDEIELAGSTSSSQTVSGLAAIVSSRSTVTVSVAFAMVLLLLLHSLCFPLERSELLVPERIEERLDLREPLRASPVQPLRAVPPFVHQTGLLQDAEVLRDRGPRHVEVRRNLAGAQLPSAHELEDAAPARLGDRSQGGFHVGSVSVFLR